LILLDTHVVIWLAQDYQRISATAQSKIEDARRKDRSLAISDRIIGATALVEGLTLVTADREIRKSRAVPTIW
jgi:PIN domain nuclease of toxin-antitoxin system